MSWVAVALLMLTVQAAPGVGGGVAVRATVVPDSLRIGDRITLSVEVSGVTQGAEVVFPQLPDSGAVVALGPPLLLPIEADGARWARYELVVWDLGVVPLPEAEVRIVTEAAELVIAVPALSVHVASVLPEAADPDTLAWRPPADVVGGNWSIQEKLAAAGLALALLLVAVFYARRRASVQPPPPPPVQPPRARALAALERLTAAGLVDAGELKALYSALSYIVREFLAETDRTWRLDLTTAELVQAVGRDGLGERRQRALAGLLAGADLVKFARRRPSRAQAARALDATRRWIVEFERIVVEPRLEPEPEPALAPEPLDDLLSVMDEVFAAGAEQPEERERLEP